MKKIMIICCVVWCFAACSGFLEEYSQDLSRVESYTDLDEVLLGDAYLPVGRVWRSGNSINVENKYFQVAHYMSDELTVYTWSKEGDNGFQEEMFGWHTWQQNVGLNAAENIWGAEDTDWNEAYHCINTCNMVLDDIDKQPAENEKQELEKSRIKGEACFLRALYYFTLINLYGEPYCSENLEKPGIPLKLTSYVEDREYRTNTIREVYEQILKDLDGAEICLEKTVVKNHPYRADITAVYLLKSRFYLYMQNWEQAYKYARKVLEKNNNLLDLNDLSDEGQDVFDKLSPETIFSMGGHILASSIYNKRGFDRWHEWESAPVYVISDDLAAAFEEGPNDLRTKYYIMKDVVGGTFRNPTYSDAWVFRKIVGWELNDKEISDHFLFRTSEAYLNAAEAAAYLGEEEIARDLLKTLRDHRMLSSRTLTESGENLISFIRKERQRELCLEGHRWNDLRRYMVCEKYPYSKAITHYYTKFHLTGPEYSRKYVLKENDPAYTLALPREVLDFQNTLGKNHRPVRESMDYVPEAPDDVTPPEE